MHIGGKVVKVWELLGEDLVDSSVVQIPVDMFASTKDLFNQFTIWYDVRNIIHLLGDNNNTH